MSAPAADSSPASKRPHLLPKCPYADKCYRKNPQHLREYDHTPSDEPATEADSSKPPCPFGWTCYRKNLDHRMQMYHPPPPKVRPLSPFALPFDSDGEGDSARTPFARRELAMMKLMGSIKDKPDWFTKVHDPVITAKWIKEAKEQSNQLTYACLRYVIDELKWQANNLKDGIQMTGIDGVYQADHIIPADLKQSFANGVALLENVPESKLDWHPGSNKQVLDLVHPSLYCYVIGQTRLTAAPSIGVAESLQTFGQGQPETGKKAELSAKALEYSKKQKEKAKEAAAAGGSFGSNDMPNKPASLAVLSYSESPRFQWLPSVFDVSESGDITIESYINNLHPVEHASLYPAIAHIFKQFIPLFEQVLTSLKHPRKPRYTIEPYSWYDKPAGWVNEDAEQEDGTFTATDDAESSNGRNSNHGDGDGDGDGDEEDEDMDEDEDDWENRRLYHPNIGVFNPPADIAPEKKISLAGRKLNVIVKVANIILTPDNPEYNGGAWHVEGMTNESIVASGIYYWQSENISESRLAFRHACSEPEYEQSDDRGVETVFGLENEGALNQVLGSLITQGDRCIAFPNIYQHQVQPFKLIDSTKPGIRKILVFFLCDPAQELISTQRVPPQQLSWLNTATTAWHREILDNTPLIDPLIRIVLAYNHDELGAITQEQAEQQREDLMLERKYFLASNNEELFEREFSLCEH